MTAIVLSDLTEVKLDGKGVFDSLMRAAKVHLEDQYNKGIIRGTEYATVYLGQLESSMQTALAFLSTSQRIGLEANLLEKQIALADAQLLIAQAQLLQTQAQTTQIEAQTALINQQKDNAAAELAQTQAQTALINSNKAKTDAETLLVPKQGQQLDAQTALTNSSKAKTDAEALLVPKQGQLLDQQVLTAKQQVINAEVEKRLLEAKVCESQAAFDYTKQNTLKATAEVTLLGQKTATEKAQILSMGVDADSVVGRQKNLYLAQTNGFQRDAEQKAAGLYIDVYKTFRMTDNEFPIPQSLDSTNLTSVLNVLRAGISAPAA